MEKTEALNEPGYWESQCGNWPDGRGQSGPGTPGKQNGDDPGLTGVRSHRGTSGMTVR